MFKPWCFIKIEWPPDSRSYICVGKSSLAVGEAVCCHPLNKYFTLEEYKALKNDVPLNCSRKTSHLCMPLADTVSWRCVHIIWFFDSALNFLNNTSLSPRYVATSLHTTMGSSLNLPQNSPVQGSFTKGKSKSIRKQECRFGHLSLRKSFFYLWCNVIGPTRLLKLRLHKLTFFITQIW